MLGDVHYSPMAGRQAGSVLAEFLVVSAAVLVPLAILMPLLFKYIENRQYVEQAARYAAWERTAYYLSAPSHLPSSAPVKGAAQIQREVDNRILAEGQAPIHREQRQTSHVETLNPNLNYWNRTQQQMAPLYEQNAGGESAQWASVAVTNQGLERRLSDEITDFTSLLMQWGTSGFYLTNDGQYRSEVTLQLAELDAFPELNAAPMSMSRSNTLIADGWGQGGPESAASAARSLNIVGRWGDGTFSGAINTVTNILSYIPMMGAIGTLEMGKVDVEAVPCINLGQMRSDGSVTPAPNC